LEDETMGFWARIWDFVQFFGQAFQSYDRYVELSRLSDRQLEQMGLRREDIAGTVMGEKRWID
jgi:uncharacterized protein YjiS (DUF1127 family)